MPMSEEEMQDDARRAKAIDRYVRGDGSLSRSQEDEPVDSAAIANVAAYWRSLDAVKDDPAILALRELALRNISTGAVELDEARPTPANENAVGPRHWYQLRGPWIALAASLLVAVCLGGSSVWLQYAADPHPTVAVRARILENGVGAPRSWRLADGSRVTLDSQSRVAIPEWTDTRSIQLETGRAFFQVAHDQAHPFVVHAEGNQVTAVGTAFAVSLASEQTDVTLAEGKVRVDMPEAAAGSKFAYLLPGQRLRMSARHRWTISTSDETQDIQWREGVLTFDNAPLEQVIAEMNRYLVNKIAVPAKEFRSLRVSGVFRVDDPVGFQQAIESLKAGSGSH